MEILIHSTPKSGGKCYIAQFTCLTYSVTILRMFFNVFNLKASSTRPHPQFQELYKKASN